MGKIPGKSLLGTTSTGFFACINLEFSVPGNFHQLESPKTRKKSCLNNGVRTPISSRYTRTVNILAVDFCGSKFGQPSYPWAL